MKRDYIPVEGHSSLARDPVTGAIVNINSTEIRQARLRKQLRNQSKTEIEQLKDDVAQLKLLVGKLIEKNQ